MYGHDVLVVGDRVEIHPATDRWMVGDRFGVVTTDATRSGKYGPRFRVRFDRSGDVRWIAVRFLREVSA